MEPTNVRVSVGQLIELQTSLRKLSQNLMDTYDSLNSALKILGEDWEDDKFDEFETEFRSSKEDIHEIAERYLQWATSYLQARIDELEEYERSSIRR